MSGLWGPLEWTEEDRVFTGPTFEDEFDDAPPECSCWHSLSMEFFPEHCPIAEHRKAAS